MIPDRHEKKITMDHHACFTGYQNLLQKIDDFSASVFRQYREYILCAYGCTSCCQHDLTILPLEFYYLCQVIETCPEIKERLLLHQLPPEAGSCILLDQGGCTIYPHRPVICRTHGLPLSIHDSNREFRDCCPKNFSGHSLDSIPAAHVLHLERVNTILTALNRLFSSSRGINPEARIPIGQLLYSMARRGQ